MHHLSRRERAAARRAAAHDERRLVVAADWAITRAARAAHSGPLLDAPATPFRVRVTAVDVVQEAAELFGWEPETAAAGAVLAARLRLRGYAVGP